MELKQEGGNSLSLEVGSPTLIGRGLGSGLGLSSSDRTISRCHVSLQLKHPVDAEGDFNDEAEELQLQFEVIGKNPILVCSRGGGGKRVYRKSEKGVLKAGDCISLSIKNPVLYVVKRREGGKAEVDASVLDAVARRERRTLQRRKEAKERVKLEEGSRGDDEEFREGSEPEIGYLEISEIDPVKEFGFLVRGHEFDQYPSRMIRPFKNWNLFLEDTRGRSDDDNEEDKAASTKLKGRQKKKKKGDDNDDEDWIEVSDNEKTLAAKAPSVKRPRYSTRSKNPKNVCSSTQSHKRPADKKPNSQHTELDDEDDETLGGFIVGDNDLEEEVEEEEVEEEEEEEEEEEDDDDDEEEFFQDDKKI